MPPLFRDRHSGTAPVPPQPQTAAPTGPQPGYSGDGFWPGYLRGGYFDTAGALRVEYVDREHMAPLAKAMADGRLTVSQVRRFFSHCRAIEGRIKAFGPEKWAVEATAFARVDVFAADALSKNKIPHNFHEFLQRNVAAVSTAKDFLDGFMPHFEALVGFGNAHFAKTERN